MVSYMAMAHSHVQRMLREGLELESIEKDCGGAYRFRHGAAVYYLSVGRGGHLLKIWSQAAYGVKPTKSVLREVNSANERLMHCRAYMSGKPSSSRRSCRSRRWCRATSRRSATRLAARLIAWDRCWPLCTAATSRSRTRRRKPE